MQKAKKVIIQVKTSFIPETEKIITQLEQLGFIHEWNSKFSGNIMGILHPSNIPSFKKISEIASIQPLYDVFMI